MICLYITCWRVSCLRLSRLSLSSISPSPSSPEQYCTVSRPTVDTGTKTNMYFGHVCCMIQERYPGQHCAGHGFGLRPRPYLRSQKVVNMSKYWDLDVNDRPKSRSYVHLSLLSYVIFLCQHTLIMIVMRVTQYFDTCKCHWTVPLWWFVVKQSRVTFLSVAYLISISVDFECIGLW